MFERLLQKAEESKVGFVRVDVVLNHFTQEAQAGNTPTISDYETLINQLREGSPDIVSEDDVAMGKELLTRLSIELGVGQELELGPHSNTTIDRYSIYELVGQGGHGMVYRAHDNVENEPRALKIFDKPIPTRAMDYVVKHETVVNVSRRHQGFADIYRHFTDQAGRVIYVMEYVPGMPLSQSMGLPWHPDHALDLMCELARAVELLHGLGLIIRDLKPANIMQPDDGPCSLKLIDLDLCGTERPIGHPRANVEGVPRAGTKGYRSPEAEKGRRLTKASDVYAFGVILFEMITTKHPEGIAKQERRRLLNDCSIPARRLIERCLSANPKLRYRDATEFLTHCEAATNGGLIYELPAARVKRFARENRALVLAGCASLVLLAVTIGLIARGPDTEVVERTKTQIVEREVSVDPPIPPELLLAQEYLRGTRLSNRHNRYVPPWDYAKVTEFEAPEKVFITTEPEGADVVFIALDYETLEPNPDVIFRPNTKSPCSLYLQPGPYLVVASIGDELFHEVYRYVPRRGDKRFSYTHMRSEAIGANYPQGEVVLYHDDFWRTGEVQLPSIRLHGPELSDDLVDCGGFLIGETEVTSAAFQQPFAITYPNSRVEPNYPIHMVAGSIVVDWAEAHGYRLPTVREYEFLASKAMIVEPMANDEAKKELYAPFEVRSETHDVVELESGAKVYGILTSVHEWTANTFDLTPVPTPALPHEQRIIFGGDAEYFERISRVPDLPPTIRSAGSAYKSVGLGFIPVDSVGFRCARSKLPRNNRKRLLDHVDSITY